MLRLRLRSMYSSASWSSSSIATFVSRAVLATIISLIIEILQFVAAQIRWGVTGENRYGGKAISPGIRRNSCSSSLRDSAHSRGCICNRSINPAHAARCGVITYKNRFLSGRLFGRHALRLSLHSRLKILFSSGESLYHR